MDKKSTLCQLMGMRMNGIKNGITEQDEDYQTLLRTVDEYSSRLEALHLPEETMKLIDRYVSEYNAIGSRYGMLAYLLGFSDCRELLLDTAHNGKEVSTDGLQRHTHGSSGLSGHVPMPACGKTAGTHG